MTDREQIEQAYAGDLPIEDAREAVQRTIDALDRGEVRVAQKVDGVWIVNEWLKLAILLSFRLGEMTRIEAGDLHFHDKIPVKEDLAGQGVRVVPPGMVRYGAHCEPGVIVMPGFVNIGAYVGAGTMVDTWATVGSCAQIGRNVHLAGGVGIGGVLEPPNATPVIVEDGAFIGSRCIVTEGALIGEGAILGANTTITASIPIIDVTKEEAVEYRAEVPPGAIVVQGTRPRTFPGGTVQLQCAYIIGWREDRHDERVGLNEHLRELGVQL
jgi:2,3,4,5-tetrahydropyridine-2,6-dicarboxylate N-succinyltransferase